MPFFFFFFSQDQNNSNKHEVNEDLLHNRNRQDILEIEARLLVLRLLQIRDEKRSLSIKQNGTELPYIKELKDTDLSKLSIDEINTLASKIGYEFTCRVHGVNRVFSKINIEINGKKYAIRCFDHTERPLINHSTRDKFVKLCHRAGVDIAKLDDAVDSYWELRNAGVFNEDCIFTSPLNPFLEIKDDLRKLLTYISFHANDMSKEWDDARFEVETIDGYIDYTNPCDESTWDVLEEDAFFDKVWTHLRFSLRADKGMPNGGLVMPIDPSIKKWTREWKNKRGETVFKGALHIRISKYVTAINETPVEELFSIKYQEEIKEVNINQGERDEYLLKLFLIECRQNKRLIPIGDNLEMVDSVQNSKMEELDTPKQRLIWEEASAGLLVYICKQIKAGKAATFDKADVFVNGIGISVKSQRGAAPSIINQTTRDKILRVMRAINSPIEPLDHIVNRYWFLRLNGGTEDVSGLGENNPFAISEDGKSNLPILRPLLNYFTFKGTGTRDSSAPATYVLSVGNPTDTSTWTYYSEDNFVDSVWENLVFSIRGKGLPAIISEENKPWVRDVDGNKKGTLNVRVKK